MHALLAAQVKDDEDAIKLMNDSPFGLTASIWTSDVDAAVSIGDRYVHGTNKGVRSGRVWG